MSPKKLHSYDQEALELFERIEVEALDAIPEPENPQPLRGRVLTCPHCATARYFGIGDTPGFVRSSDLHLSGTTACCGKPVLVSCGQFTTIRAVEI